MDISAQSISVATFAQGRHAVVPGRGSGFIHFPDGKHSRITQLVHAPSYMEQPSLICWYVTYWSDFPSEGLELHWRHRRLAITLPTNDGLVMAAVGWPHQEFNRFRSDIKGNYLKTLRMMPSLAERLPGARRAGRFLGMGDLPNYFRKPYGLGWALVGDAGYHKDPITGQGMSDAFRDAEMLADRATRGLERAAAPGRIAGRL